MKSSTILEQIEIPAWVVELEVPSLYAVLQGVKDLRKLRGRRYEAGLLLVLMILAKLAGMKTIAGVAEWVQLRSEWLGSVSQQVLGLYNVSDDYMVQQVPIAGKGHERAAGLQLIRQVDLHDCLVSADALHTQPKWCGQILAQGGDYLVIAKGNQSELRAEIALLFSQPPLPWLPESEATQTNKGHGRLEVRHLRASAELSDFLAPKWPGVQQVFQLQRRIWRQGQLTTEVVYGMTSLPVQRTSVAALLALVRAHWHIENRSHWRRDVTLGEDRCKVASPLAPQLLAALNNVVLALMDYLHVDNVASQIRRFDAAPAEALALLMTPL